MEKRGHSPSSDGSTLADRRTRAPSDRLAAPLVSSPALVPAPVRDLEAQVHTRQIEEILSAVELVMGADGTAFWREEEDHSLTLEASRGLSRRVLDALEQRLAVPLRSIMLRWPESPLIAVPLGDPSNQLAEEMGALAAEEGITGIAGLPCHAGSEMLGLVIVVHTHAYEWTIRDLGLGSGLAGQLATALINRRLLASVETLASRLAAINELSLRLAGLQDETAIAEAIVREVGRLVGCGTARVYRRDDSTGLLRVVAASGTFLGIDNPPLDALSIGAEETLPAWVAHHDRPLAVPDAAADRRSIFRSSFGPESVLLAPISCGEAVHGVLAVTRPGAGAFGPADQQALAALARYAAQATVNARTVRQLEREHEALERQLEAQKRMLAISEQLVSTLDPRRVLDQIAGTIGSVIRYDRLTIYRLDTDGATLRPLTCRSVNGEEVDVTPDERSLEEGLTSWVIGRGEAVCADDVGGGPGGAMAGGGTARLLGLPAGEGHPGASIAALNVVSVPLRVHGTVTGSLNLARAGEDARFSEQEFDLAKLFAGQASIAIQNAEAHLTVATRADLDALTGLRNHGTFQRDLARAVAGGAPFSLLMMDLDAFKAYNDTYGHPAGDGLLQAVAVAVVGATRQNDRAYRYGGDEFAVLLPGASRVHAGEVAARIRRAVGAVPGQNRTVRVGISVGAAHWPEDGKDPAELVVAADSALYRAKRQREALVPINGAAAGTLAAAAQVGFVAASAPRARSRPHLPTA